MNRIETIFTIIVLLLFIKFNTAKAQSYSKEVNKKINQVENNLSNWIHIDKTPKWTLRDRMKYYNTKSVSIAVIKNYKLEWVKAYGFADSAENRIATTSTLFQAASLSKSINAIGLLKLAQDKRINLNEDINSYLKSWKFPYDSLSKGKKITTENLLSHTAGLTVHGFDGYDRQDVLPTIYQILDGKKPANSAPIRSMYEPNINTEYSGGGTLISQLILQDVTSEKYEDYMKKNVLKPLGMKNSFFDINPPSNKQNLLATGYYNDGKEIKGKYHVYPEQAPAGLWTTPTDLAKYVIETQLDLQGKSNKVLTKEMTDLRLKPHFDDTEPALGLFIDDRSGTKYFHHEGMNEGFTSVYIGSLKDGNGIVIMSNSNEIQLLNEITNSVAFVYNWENYKPETKKEVVVTDEIAEPILGKYKDELGNSISISKNNNKIWFSFRENPPMEIHFLDSSSFFITEMSHFEFKCQTDKITGKVNLITLDKVKEHHEAKRVE